MSQDNIDKFLEWLENHPDKKKEIKGLKASGLAGYALALGFKFTVDEIKARQALIHLIEGT